MPIRRPRALPLAALLAAPGCTVPSTLGLPCVTHEHCDPGQHCGPDGTCLAGPPMGPPMTTSGPTSSDSLSGTGTTTATTTADTTVVLEGTSSSSGAPTTLTEGTSTGPACGLALGTCDALDLLFVIDNSGSMMEDNGVLIPALASVQALLVSQLEGVCSYHIGLTTTEPALDFPAQAGCEVRGALSRGGVLCPDGPWDDPEHAPWVSEHDDIQSLGCLFGVMQEQDDDEKQLDTILAAVGEELGAPGGCNEGFVRDGVPLIVVLVTDEDDDDDSSTPGEDPDRTGSALAPEDWWEALTAIKAPAELSVVLLAATNPGTCSFTPQPGSNDGTGAEYAQNILEFLGYFIGSGYGSHVRAIDLCQPVEDLVAKISVVEEVLATACEDATG